MNIGERRIWKRFLSLGNRAIYRRGSTVWAMCPTGDCGVRCQSEIIATQLEASAKEYVDVVCVGPSPAEIAAMFNLLLDSHK